MERDVSNNSRATTTKFGGLTVKSYSSKTGKPKPDEIGATSTVAQGGARPQGASSAAQLPQDEVLPVLSTAVQNAQARQQARFQAQQEAVAQEWVGYALEETEIQRANAEVKEWATTTFRDKAFPDQEDINTNLFRAVNKQAHHINSFIKNTIDKLEELQDAAKVAEKSILSRFGKQERIKANIDCRQRILELFAQYPTRVIELQYDLEIIIRKVETAKTPAEKASAEALLKAVEDTVKQLSTLEPSLQALVKPLIGKYSAETYELLNAFANHLDQEEKSILGFLATLPSEAHHQSNMFRGDVPPITLSQALKLVKEAREEFKQFIKSDLQGRAVELRSEAFSRVSFWNVIDAMQQQGKDTANIKIPERYAISQS